MDERGAPNLESHGADPADPPDDVIARIADLVAQVMTRRYAGESLPDARVIADHVDLMPWLAHELRAQADLHRVYLAAQKAGPGTPGLAADADDDPTAHLRSTVEEPILGYCILNELGGGGQATVYAAVQEATGRKVAIKILPGGALAGSRHRARFDREAQIMATLDHPNIVGILDRGRTRDGSFFLVMPLVDGVALDRFAALSAADDDAFPRPLLHAFACVAHALHEAHERGVIHRDVKPSNVLVDARREPHVLDFGLALAEAGSLGGAAAERAITGGGADGQIVGSLPWASPEHVNGAAAAIGPQSDVYSLGVCLFQCLTGAMPYPVDGSIRDVADRILSQPPPAVRLRPHQRPGAVDRDALDRVVARAMAKAPADRYPTAAALAADLESVLAARPVLVLPAVPADRHRTRRRARLVAVALASTALVAAAAYLIHVDRASRAPVKLPAITAAPASVPHIQRVTLSAARHVNKLGMHLVKIPGGRFQMGAAEAAMHGADERWHTVEIGKPYWIADREVTRRQYRDVMGDVPRAPVPPHDPLDHDGDLPVTDVTWDEATAFCGKLGPAADGWNYRLPTEAEWERACRAGTATEWAGRDRPDEIAWHFGNSGGILHAGGAKTANRWALFDMHGNVAEWCRDAYQPDYPRDFVDPLVDQGTTRVIRGGAFDQTAADCRSASRAHLAPDQRRPNLGFRVAASDRTPPATTGATTAPTPR